MEKRCILRKCFWMHSMVVSTANEEAEQSDVRGGRGKISSRGLNVAVKMLHVAPDVLKTASFSETVSLFPECSTFPMAGVSSMVDWYGAFNGFYGSLCKERCTGWNNSVSAGPEADRGPGLMTGPSQTRGPLATSHSVCPPPGHPCWWSRARCFSEA